MLLRSCAGSPATSVCTASCGPATPITRNHCSFTFTNRPMGLSAPKSTAAAAWPSTATASAVSLSRLSKKRPDTTRSPDSPAYAGATPNTTGISPCGRGSSFDGVSRLRALTAARPPTFASTTRRSCSDSPADSFRTFCSA